MMVAGLVESLATSWPFQCRRCWLRTRCEEKRMLVFRLARILTLVVVAAAALGTLQAASAATFAGVGQHTLTSANLAFNAGTPLSGGSICTSSIFEVNVAAGGATATVTGATFTGCTGTGSQSGTITVAATGFPWSITRTAAGVFTIDSVTVNELFESSGLILTLRGNLPGGTINCTTHTITYVNNGPLTVTADPVGLDAVATVSGHLRDDQNSLCVT
jgi:hypothetical protein